MKIYRRSLEKIGYRARPRSRPRPGVEIGLGLEGTAPNFCVSLLTFEKKMNYKIGGVLTFLQNMERGFMQKLSIQDLPVKNKKILMRVDFNVPLDKQGNITDDTRIVASLPSVRYVLDNGGVVILMSHLGRPKNGFDSKLSLKPCAHRLSQLLGQTVLMAPN